MFVASARDKVARGTGAAATCTNMPHSRSALPPGRATRRAPVVRFAPNGMGAVSSRVTLRGTPPDSRTDLSGDGEKRCATPAAFAPGDRGGARIAVWSTPTGPPTRKSTRTACTASVRGRCSGSGRSTGSAGGGALLGPLRCMEPAAWGPAGQTVAVPARSALPGGKRRPVAGLPGGGGRSRKLEPPPRGPERDHQTSGRGRGGYWQSARPRKLPAGERAAHGAVRSARRRARVQEPGEEVEFVREFDILVAHSRGQPVPITAVSLDDLGLQALTGRCRFTTLCRCSCAVAHPRSPQPLFGEHVWPRHATAGTCP